MHFSRWCLKFFTYAYLCGMHAIFLRVYIYVRTNMHVHQKSTMLVETTDQYFMSSSVVLHIIYWGRVSHLNQSFTDLSSLATQMSSSTLHLSGAEDLNSFPDECTSGVRTFTHRTSICIFLLLLLLGLIQIYSCVFVPV